MTHWLNPKSPSLPNWPLLIYLLEYTSIFWACGDAAIDLLGLCGGLSRLKQGQVFFGLVEPRVRVGVVHYHQR